jgi:hypothetical protein
MTILIWIIVGIALFQFVWYGIAAPPLRMALRYRLFAQRDRLRGMASAGLSREVFDLMHNSVNSAIRFLPEFDLAAMFTVRNALRVDPELRAEIERRNAVLDSCPIKDVRDIKGEVTKTMMLGLAANSGGWLIWLIPIALTVAMIGTVYAIIDSALALPKGEADRLGLSPQGVPA